MATSAGELRSTSKADSSAQPQEDPRFASACGRFSAVMSKGLRRASSRGRAGDAAKYRPYRSRLQPAPHPRLAEHLVVPHPDSAHTSLHDPLSAQISLLTDDQVAVDVKSDADFHKRWS